MRSGESAENCVSNCGIVLAQRDESEVHSLSHSNPEGHIMIHHLSIAVDHPLHVAEVLATLWNGKVAPFPPHPGSYIVLALDSYGTMIELYPAETELMPGCGYEQAAFSQNAFASPFAATHAAISVPACKEQIEQIAAQEGWRMLHCSRDGLFEVIELWVENKLMLELLTPQMARKYLDFMRPQNLEAFFAIETGEAVAV